MAGENDTPGVNYERSEVPPTADDETLEPEDTDPESPQENEGEPEDGVIDPENDPADASPDGKPEKVGAQPPQTQTETPVVVPTIADDPSNPRGLKRQPDETAREWALRLELADTRSQLRGKRTGQVMKSVQTPQGGAPVATPVDDRTKAILEKYPKEQLDALREVFPALAAEMGFVSKTELAGESYTTKVQEYLDSFVDAHPEYSPAKDPDGVLWNAFIKEFGQYKQPTNPKDYKALFEKVHKNVFGIQGSGALPKIVAAQRKVQVASHAGASGPTAPTRQTRSGAGSGLRLDMLKGFDDESKERISARAQGD